ncbi:putative RiPP precursor [Granulicella sp. S190]|uniref:putative RiPP precursor n=1 Tax=Granulicella sp. S190 TaxID=1747226 RepID=UPI00131BE6D6|nr:putative RiPP precursor [Granulicella sp. S190]
MRASVEVGAAKKVAADSADQLAAAVFQTGGAGGAEAGVMLGGDGAGGWGWIGCS